MVVVTVTPEIGLEELYTYAGGLGVLEGDRFLGAVSQGLDYVVLTLFYRRGYVDYKIDGTMVKVLEQKHPVDPASILVEENPLHITLRGERVTVKPLIYRRGSGHVVFFEAVNPHWARRLTDRVYIEDNETERIYKYILLAKASAVYIRERIGLENISVVDLQEAYTALVALALPEYKNYRFITHTLGPWGHPVFPAKILEEEFGYKAKDSKVTLTIIGFEVAKKAFAVSKKHYEVTKQIFPQYTSKLSYVTNGVYLERWLSQPIKKMLKIKDVNAVTLDEFKRARIESRKALVELIKSRKPIAETEDKPILVWARRITRYKRPYFVTRLIEENPDITSKAVFVLAGKPHPHDRAGLKYLKEYIRISQKYTNVVYVESYDIAKAKVLLSGGDVLLFTPFSGWEACGTSYMKSMANGVPVIASRDGGSLELIVDNVNGWLFGRENRSLIDLDSTEAKAVDEEDYNDFARKIQDVIRVWGSEEYWRIGLEALRSSINKISIERVLNEYYSYYSSVFCKTGCLASAI
jgi:starch phosphorylase